MISSEEYKCQKEKLMNDYGTDDSKILEADLLMENILIEKYQEIEARGIRPKEAWYIESSGKRSYIKPAIPFVGKNYLRQKTGCKVLLYASAENLAGYGSNINELTKVNGMKRCRDSFLKSNDYFPNIHIQPINDGGLLVAAYQILKRIIGDDFWGIYGEMTPRDFLECICCANYGKFSVLRKDGNKNIDYANSSGIEILQASHEYIRADLEILNPDIIVIPSGMYYLAKQKELLLDKLECISNAKVVPIYQINAQVVNCTMYPAMMKMKYGKIFSRDMLSENELKWHDAIKRINKEKFLSIYSYIDFLGL